MFLQESTSSSASFFYEEIKVNYNHTIDIGVPNYYWGHGQEEEEKGYKGGGVKWSDVTLVDTCAMLL